MKTAFLIPARSGSLRVKDKNLRRVNGFSLAIRKVLQVQGVDAGEIYVGTDSEEIADTVSYEANVVYRDPRCCDETRSTANEMIVDFVSRVEADVIVWAHCTNPFLYARHYRAALSAFYTRKPSKDSLASVVPIQAHAWYRGQPRNFTPGREPHQLAKDLQPVHVQDGGIFIQRRSDFLKNRYFYGRNPILHEHDPLSGFDINTPEDLQMACAVARDLDTKEGFFPNVV